MFWEKFLWTSIHFLFLLFIFYFFTYSNQLGMGDTEDVTEPKFLMKINGNVLLQNSLKNVSLVNFAFFFFIIQSKKKNYSKKYF